MRGTYPWNIGRKWSSGFHLWRKTTWRITWKIMGLTPSTSCVKLQQQGANIMHTNCFLIRKRNRKFPEGIFDFFCGSKNNLCDFFPVTFLAFWMRRKHKIFWLESLLVPSLFASVPILKCMPCRCPRAQVLPIGAFPPQNWMKRCFSTWKIFLSEVWPIWWITLAMEEKHWSFPMDPIFIWRNLRIVSSIKQARNKKQRKLLRWPVYYFPFSESDDVMQVSV